MAQVDICFGMQCVLALLAETYLFYKITAMPVMYG
jgi:hypothetical protein